MQVTGFFYVILRLKKIKMKKSFSLLEIIIVITLIGFLYTIFIPKTNPNKLEEITNKISLYLSYVRFKAMIDDKFDEDDNSYWSRSVHHVANETSFNADFNYDGVIINNVIDYATKVENPESHTVYESIDNS